MRPTTIPVVPEPNFFLRPYFAAKVGENISLFVDVHVYYQEGCRAKRVTATKPWIY